MPILAVDIFKLDSLIGDLEVLESNFNDRINTVSSSYSEVTSIYNEFGYLTSAANELAYKVDELEESRDRISAFKTIVSEFRTMAHDEESGMADRIFMDADTFMDEMGITPEYEKSAWDKFCDKLSDIETMVWEGLQDIAGSIYTFVKDYVWPTLIVAGELLVAVAAITLFIVMISNGAGVLALIASGWGAFKAVTELMGDVFALGYTIAGDEERAKEAAAYDAKELFNNIGEGLNDLSGWDYWDELMDGAYIGLDTIELIVDVKEIVSPKKILDSDIQELKDFGDTLADIGNTIKEIPDNGVFAITNFDKDKDFYSDIYRIFDNVYDYFDSTSGIVTGALEENNVISESVKSNFDNAVDFGGFVKDICDDNIKMTNKIGTDGFSTFDKFLMEEGNIQETINFFIDLSE